LSVILSVFEREFRKLSPAQKRCVLHNDGKAVVLAGPGSGKTRVISVRLLRLICEKKPVLTLSFNRAAVAELKNRIMKYTGELPENVKITTVHAYCYEIINEYYRAKGDEKPNIIDEEKRFDVLSEIYAKIIRILFEFFL